MKKFWILTAVIVGLYCGIKSGESIKLQEMKSEFADCEDVMILEDGSVVISESELKPVTNGTGNGAVISIELTEQEYQE